MKTKRGIEYDLEVYSFDGKFVCLEVTCENGTTEIYHAVTRQEYDTYNETYNIDYLNLNFDEIERWVDATEISWAVSEVTKVCLMKGYSACNISTNNEGFKISLLQCDNDVIVTLIDLTSIEQVNDWLCMNK